MDESIHRIDTSIDIFRITNGGFFQLSARLARFTGNQTYADWATKAFDWMLKSQLIEQTSPNWMIWDGVHVDDNCSSVEHTATWTYAPGVLISGAAYLYNFVRTRSIPSFFCKCSDRSPRQMEVLCGRNA